MSLIVPMLDLTKSTDALTSAMPARISATIANSLQILGGGCVVRR